MAIKKAIVITSLAGFIRSFLTHDIELLQSMGYEVHCAANIHHPGAEGMEEYFQEHNVIFHQIDFSSNKPLSKETLRAYKQVKTLKNSIKFDLVHCHTPIVGVVVRELFKNERKSGCKVIYTTHGFYFHKKSSKKTWAVFYTIEKYMSRFCDAIITINYEDYHNAKTMHCKNVYHINGVGVDTEKFWTATVDRDRMRREIGVGSEDIMVLAVGELSHRKNQKVVIEALGLLKDPRLVFIHCGNAMNGSATTKEIIETAESNHVRYKLMGLRSDIPQICKCADIGTISSTREGLGLAGIEMLASGLPVVASNVHGILDYMQDGKNGYLADPYSPAEFADGISKLMDADVRADMRNYCHESSLQFDKKISFEQMRKIYQEILHN